MNIATRLPGQWDCQWSYELGLFAGCDTIVKIPMSRWDVDKYYAPNLDNPEFWQTTTMHQSYVEGVDLFDNRHFEISNAEAGAMDPVQRQVLECGALSLAMYGITK